MKVDERDGIGTRAFGLLLVVAFVFVTMSMGFGDVTEGLRAHWTFDEIEDNTVPDASGDGNAAEVFSATLVKGVEGTALSFDGQSSSVLSRSGGMYPDAEGLTLSAWVKPAHSRFEGYPTVIRRDGVYALRFAGEHLGFLLWLDGKVIRMSSNKTDWEAGRWYHIAATYDGFRMRLYIDGSEDGASPEKHEGTVRLDLTSAYIGSLRGDNAFEGIIDDVRAYDRVLSAAQIEQLHEAGRESLVAQQDVDVEPKQVGKVVRTEYRKPKRDITMVKDGYIWIDAEDFTDYGGWTLDTQFVHLMGSGYLLANGVGEPVEDATVTVDIPQAGNYRLWVRAKNWYQPHSPGQLKVVVDGEATDKVFGKAETEDWIWQSAGEFELERGEVEIAIRDLTGYYSRCDAMILTTDGDYTPPDGKDAVCKERARLTELSLEEHDGGEFDVIVVGAGSGGFPAALAAARMGANTALIQDRPVLGGNASKELGVGFAGASAGHDNAREGGIVEELIRVKGRYGYPRMSGPMRMLADEEPNLHVFCNQRVIDVRKKSDTEMEAVVAKHALGNTMTTYRGKLFIDATGDGWIGYFADADFRFGREAESEYNERLAPEEADDITMSGCLMGTGLAYRAVNTGEPVQYTAPPWAADLPPADKFGRDPRHVRSGNWWLEHEGTIDDVWNAEKARDELLRITYGYWDFIKNESSYQERAKNYTLAKTSFADAKRESRRLMGDYVLTQDDCQNGRMFEDRVSYGGWSLDVHHPEGIYSNGEGPFYCHPRVPIYSIPYRCGYSRNIDNLMMSGRDMSVTHIALGTVRVEATLAAFGQAVGTAAGMAIKYDTTPRGIYEDHITELQQTLLKHDQYIPQLKNQDAEDLARQAKVVASSTATHERFTKDDVQRADRHEFAQDRAVMFPVVKGEKLETVHVLLASEKDEPVETTLHLREAKQSGDMSSGEDIATATATVPAGERSWVSFEVNATVNTPFAYVWLPSNEGIYWYLMSDAPLGSVRAYGNGERARWNVREGQYYAVYTEPAIATGTDYRPENVINGVSRIVGQNSNLWVSDSHESMPQWIELQFEKPRQVNAVHLTFDTNLDPRPRNIAMVPECVRDYELSYFDGEQWQTILTEQGNYQRHRIHRFDAVTTSRLRVTVNRTNGDETARIFEIRAYKE